MYKYVIIPAIMYIFKTILGDDILLNQIKAIYDTGLWMIPLNSYYYSGTMIMIIVIQYTTIFDRHIVDFLQTKYEIYIKEKQTKFIEENNLKEADVLSESQDEDYKTFDQIDKKLVFLNRDQILKLYEFYSSQNNCLISVCSNFFIYFFQYTFIEYKQKFT